MPLPGAILAALLLVLAGCLSGPDVDGDNDAALAARVTLGPCPSTLHVWLVPLDELAERTPPEFPPAVLQEEGMDTPLGRIVFYLYDCPPADGHDGGLLGLLGVRVVAPGAVAPPSEQPDWAVTPWVSVYVLSAMTSGRTQDILQKAAIPFTVATGSVAVTPTGAPDTPLAQADVSLDDGSTLAATMVGAPTRVESFSRPERYYHLVPDGSGEVRWLDVQFNMTLWETEGVVTYSAGSPWDAAVGNRAYDAAVDHHAMEATLDLSFGAGPLGAQNPPVAALGRRR